MTRPFFPALIVAPLLLAVCFFPGQIWLAHALPAISGHATVDPGLTILDIPVRLPFPVDLILVPGLFIILYSIAILILSSGLPLWQCLRQRLGAILMSISIILIGLAIGGLISWLVRDHLPDHVRNSLASMAVSADLHLPYAGYSTIPFRGDVFSFLGLIIAMVVSIRIMSRRPKTQPRFRLTRDQRMTPYQRMLLERSNAAPLQPPFTRNATPEVKPSSTPGRHNPAHGICRNTPLLTMQPEPVNYRPLD